NNAAWHAGPTFVGRGAPIALRTTELDRPTFGLDNQTTVSERPVGRLWAAMANAQSIRDKARTYRALADQAPDANAALALRAVADWFDRKAAQAEARGADPGPPDPA